MTMLLLLYYKQSKAASRKEHFFLISSSRSIDQQKDTGVVRQLTKAAIFLAPPMKKHI